MDLKSNGITWFGNIYQKLETMCQELSQDVESIMSQETKYVEGQVQAVGANVRKLCNEVMQDLLSPSACSVKGPISDLSLIYDLDVGTCKRSKIGSEECPVNEKPLSSTELGPIVSVEKDLNPGPLADASQDINNGDTCDTLINKSIPISVQVSANTFPEIGENHDIVSDVAASFTSLASTLSSELAVPILSHESEVLEGGLVLSSSGLSTNTIGTCTPHETMHLVRSTGIGHEQHKNSTVSEDSLPIPETGKSDDSDLDESSKDNIATEPTTETIEEYEDVKLEESLDMENNELYFLSHQVSKNRSYKKKIWDALASKPQPAKKDVYEQIAIWFDDIDMETKRRGGISTSSSLIEDLESNKLSSQDCCDSDWELL
ncbi:uncharacterized protein LOC143891583 isoform X2 [Tasmannia lanceolata]|uniref:uncharacterized protein LOC143891583 isoform X2 n=1 Tax=Tasmannia lanceolata TaxID=3420 RepID=UPI0040634F87